MTEVTRSTGRKNMKLGFIGCGNMAGAIIRGIIASGVVAPDEIIGADLSEQAREKISRESGILVTADNEEVVRKAFGVKEMYGIGDSYNDLPLLESVDHPYTLKHAPQQIKDAAEGVVRSVSELLDRI